MLQRVNQSVIPSEAVVDVVQDNSLKSRFERTRDAIMAREISQPVSPDTSHALVEILREVNGKCRSHMDPEALRQHGIFPTDFAKAHAVDYAKKTLGLHDNPGHHVYQDVLINRCQTALSTKDDFSFGHFLPEDLKAKVEEKLKINLPHALAPKPASL